MHSKSVHLSTNKLRLRNLHTLGSFGAGRSDITINLLGKFTLRMSPAILAVLDAGLESGGFAELVVAICSDARVGYVVAFTRGC